MSINDQFIELAGTLADAESRAKAASSDLSQIRAQRQQSAVDVIMHLHKKPPVYAETGTLVSTAALRTTMLQQGVLKGTVSKILTVVHGLEHALIEEYEVKSLNGAYTHVKNALKVLAEASAEASAEEPAASPSESAPAHVCQTPSPDEALEIIIQSIKNSGGEDDVFKAAGDWIERITTSISDITKSYYDETE